MRSPAQLRCVDAERPLIIDGDAVFGRADDAGMQGGSTVARPLGSRRHDTNFTIAVIGVGHWATPCTAASPGRVELVGVVEQPCRARRFPRVFDDALTTHPACRKRRCRQHRIATSTHLDIALPLSMRDPVPVEKRLASLLGSGSLARRRRRRGAMVATGIREVQSRRSRSTSRVANLAHRDPVGTFTGGVSISTCF